MKTQTNILVNTVQLVVVVGMGLTLMSCGAGDGPMNSALAQNTGRDFVAPTVFQAAGPNIASNEAPRSKLRGITELNSEDFSEGEATPVASYGECQVQNTVEEYRTALGGAK